MCKSSTFNSWKFLLYITPTSIVKAEPTQNVSSSLQTSTQNDRTSVKKAMRDELQLGYPNTR